MSKHRVRSSFGIVHGQAWCDDCDWNTSSYKNAQAIAAKHAAHHGHRVQVETGMHGTYDGRPTR